MSLSKSRKLYLENYFCDKGKISKTVIGAIVGSIFVDPTREQLWLASN